MNYLNEEVSLTPTIYTTRDACATSPDTEYAYGDDASEKVNPHGTEGSLAH